MVLKVGFNEHLSSCTELRHPGGNRRVDDLGSAPNGETSLARVPRIRLSLFAGVQGPALAEEC